MNIYITSSWKNQHAVEMLTDLLEKDGHIVFSFIREGKKEESLINTVDLDTWIDSKDGECKFKYDTGAAMTCDLVIYISPSGCDAWAEVGAAWSRGITVLGLASKGEQIGLMRRMVHKWFIHYRDLLEEIYCTIQIRLNENGLDK